MIHLLDNALSPVLLKALAADPPGAPWYGFARVTPHLTDPQFCRQLKESGCVMLKLGLESGDQAVLDALKKGVELETVAAALKNLKEAGIATYVYLLFGTPAETPEAARRTLSFHRGPCGRDRFSESGHLQSSRLRSRERRSCLGDVLRRRSVALQAFRPSASAGTAGRSDAFWRRNSKKNPPSRRSSGGIRPFSPRTMRPFLSWLLPSD